MATRIATTFGAAAAEKRGQAHVSDVAVTVMASVAIALPLLFYLHQHVELLRVGYEIDTLQERRAELAERTKELRVKRAVVASLARVESEAKSQGLVAPAPEDVFIAVAAPRRDEQVANRLLGMTARLD